HEHAGPRHDGLSRLAGQQPQVELVYLAEPRWTGSRAQNLTGVLVDVDRASAGDDVVRQVRRYAHSVAADALSRIRGEHARAERGERHRRTRRGHGEQPRIREVVELVLERHDAAGESEDDDERAGDKCAEKMQLDDDRAHRYVLNFVGLRRWKPAASSYAFASASSSVSPKGRA